MSTKADADARCVDDLARAQQQLYDAVAKEGPLSEAARGFRLTVEMIKAAQAAL